MSIGDLFAASAGLQPLDLPGAELAYWPAWLAPAEADALFESLYVQVPWETHVIRIRGRDVSSPRLSCWIGDPGASYVYSRTRFEPRPWPAALAALRTRIDEACGASFNSVLANLYRDGRDAMGWHSDDEPELGREPVIASLSLGAERRFVFRRKPARGQAAARAALELRLAHGSLLRMAGATQRLYQHALPRALRIAAPRINLTFRRIG
ncbi:MAG TPA: alpha-ketoglutarate-dependent dioxygenase AlkB [Frateuria sp.]|uniref:alpha-ketoglutarate-dependent dioxygenase AlkB family protein n=1 Tax=Frateuria sp. TaxID=2211372 RepID=UPI002DEE9CD1|nr:alpha-ketoglutarate-dependent dioxygenase AlkB [Frateuria sp.]